MSMTLFIPRHQFALTRKVARNLQAIHQAKSGQNFRATLTGIRAEFAVIQFVNYQLGLLKKAEFRTEYNENGGDGGFDFEMCGIKCDVKYSKDLKIPIKRIACSTADLIIACTEMKHTRTGMVIRLLGWVPRMKLLEFLRLNEQLTPAHFRTFTMIKSSMPELFGNGSDSSYKKPDFISSSEIVSELISYMEFKHDV